MKRNVLALAILSLTIASAPGEEFDLSWHSVGGGVVHSIGGPFELSGTIGQPDAGALTGGEFTLTGGFWFETPPGDCNQDGGTGLLDMRSFTDCMTGPSGAPAGNCRCFDVNHTSSADLIDFAEFQTAFNGQ
jgi:hypothetical protein